MRSTQLDDQITGAAQIILVQADGGDAIHTEEVHNARNISNAGSEVTLHATAVCGSICMILDVNFRPERGSHHVKLGGRTESKTGEISKLNNCLRADVDDTGALLQHEHPPLQQWQLA